MKLTSNRIAVMCATLFLFADYIADSVSNFIVWVML